MCKSKKLPIYPYFKNGKKYYFFKIYLGINPLDGEPKTTTRRNFKTQKEAERAYTKMKYEVQNGKYFKQRAETYQEVYDLWIQQYERSVQESTFVKTIGIFRNHILPSIGKYRITQMNFNVCQKHVNEWADKLKGANKVKSYASLVMDYAIKVGYIQTNPFALVEITKRPKVFRDGFDVDDEKLENFYNKDQLIKLLECIKDEYNNKVYTLFRLLAYSGMRKSEALALTWKDIDFKKNEIRITKAIGRGKDSKLYLKPTKTEQDRTIKMDKATMTILKEWKQQQSQELLALGYNTLQTKQLVFSNNRNTFIQPTMTNKWLKRVLTKYGLPSLTTHGLRHTHCSLLFESGAKMKVVQNRLGHKDIKTTMNIYAHVTKNAEDEAVHDFEMFMAV